MESVQVNNHVLLVWDSIENQDEIVTTVEKLKTIVGDKGQVIVENSSRLAAGNYQKSAFDVILSNSLSPHSMNHTSELLSEYLKIIKPKCKIIITQKLGNDTYPTKEKFLSVLKTSGFLVDADNVLSSGEANSVTVTCTKPNYEVGSQVKLTFNKATSTTSNVWKLMDTVDDDIETIDPDSLLDEEDFKKPDPASLRVCGTTGKRKACKDCSCGLAEELDAEKATSTGVKDSAPKSSCGSCYLGDAFRCASCPYLGMPAFKPGEKIQLTDTQLKADV